MIKMNTVKRFLIKDKNGTYVIITPPKTPSPLKVIEFEKERFKLKNITTIVFTSLIVGVIFFGIVFPFI